MAAKFSPYMYGAPYIFHFVHPLVKPAGMMVQRVNFERNLKNIRPATVYGGLGPFGSRIRAFERFEGRKRLIFRSKLGFAFWP